MYLFEKCSCGLSAFWPVLGSTLKLYNKCCLHPGCDFVTFSQTYFYIFMQDERNQILSAYLWIRQSWYDAYLKWDKDKYDGLDSIRIPSNLVWRPDIVLYNKWVWLEKISLNICLRKGGGWRWNGPMESELSSLYLTLARGIVCCLNRSCWSSKYFAIKP